MVNENEMPSNQTAKESPLENQQKSCKILVVDSGGIIKALDKLPLLASEMLVTIPEVMAEIRDKKSRELLESSISILSKLQVKVPSAESVKKVAEFARKTGDYSTLSAVDLRVLSLVYELETSRNGTDHLRNEPAKIVFNDQKQKKPKRNDGKKDITKQMEEMSLKESKESKEIVKKEQVDANDKDDDEGWITPSNIRKKNHALSGPVDSNPKAMEKPADVACITTDFAMQNVLLQMGLNLISVDGIQIKSIKNWILRCHACFATTPQMDKKFCEKCGGPTLTRVSCALNAKTGELRLFLKRNFQFNLRGTKYAVPKPKGGRNEELIFREDQKEFTRAMFKEKRIKEKMSKKDDSMDAGLFEFGNGSRKNQEMYTGVRIGFGKRNPNQVRRK